MSMNLRPRKRHVPVIPIVSLIDIMVILLIFFVATTTFRRQKAHLKIALPESKGVGGVSADAGNRLAITVTKDQKIQLDGQPVEVAGSPQRSAGSSRTGGSSGRPRSA